MKKLLSTLILFLGSAFAQTITPNLALIEPAHGAPNWDAAMNTNFNILDTDIGSTVYAANFSGATWTQKVATAVATAPCNTVGCTLVIQDSIAGDGHLTTLSVPSNVQLLFPGNGVFTECTMNVGQFTKIKMQGAQLKLSGSGCIGINLTTQALFQVNDKFILDGVRIDCQSQTNSTGVFFGGNTAQVATYNVSIKNCTTTDAQFDGAQFSENYNMNLGNVTASAALILHSTNPGGGANSNTFYGLKVWSSAVGILIYADTSIGQGANYFINPSILSSTTTGLCAFGNTFPTDVHWYGGAPEATGGGPSTVTVNGQVCKKATIYANLASVQLVDISIADATSNPWAIAENASHFTFTNGGGYGLTSGVLVQTDSTSTTSIDGAWAHLGTVQNVVAYPATFQFMSFSKMYGAPILQYTTTVPNVFSGNPQTPAFSDINGASSQSTATDATYGLVRTVTYAASTGSANTNRANFGLVTGVLAANSDILTSVLIKSSVDAAVSIGDFGQGNSVQTVNLKAGQWTRAVNFYGGYLAAGGITLVAWAANSSGATVSFTGLEVIVSPTNTTGAEQVMNTVLVSGAVNPNLGNCSAVGTAASPSVASCANAAQGNFSCATNATGATCQVNTTRVTANSQIYVQEDETVGGKLGVTCNTSTNVLPTSRLLAGRATGTSFSINLGTITTNPACFSYSISN